METFPRPGTSWQQIARRSRAVPLLLLLLLTSCRSTVTTVVHVEDGRADGNLVVVLAGEAAGALRDDPATDQRLMAELARRSGDPVDRGDDGDSITYRTSLPTGSSDLLVTGVEVGPIRTGEDGTNVTLTFLRPSTLVDAITGSVRGEADSAARELVMQRSTEICAEVNFGGRVTAVRGAEGFRIERTDGSVLLCRTLEEMTAPTEIVVTGTDGDRFPLLPAVGLFLVLGALLVARRRSATH